MKKAVLYSAVIAVGASIAFLASQPRPAANHDQAQSAQTATQNQAGGATGAVSTAASSPEMAMPANPSAQAAPEPAAPESATPESATPQLALEIPEPAEPATTAPGDELELWQIPEDAATIKVDDIPAKAFQVDPNKFAQLRVGQTLNLPISPRGESVTATVTSTYNDPAGVQVWLAEVQDAQPGSNVIVTQGQKETHVVIASEKGTYSAVIDNASGEATLIDEGEIHARVAPFDDGVVVGPDDEVPPPVAH